MIQIDFVQSHTLSAIASFIIERCKMSYRECIHWYKVGPYDMCAKTKSDCDCECCTSQERVEQRADNNASGEIAERLLRDLLAVIHRDGGHYTHDNGLEKSTKDAMEIVVQLFLT